MKKLKYLLLLLLLGDLSSSVWAKPTIVIDSGHQPSQAGAKASCGLDEVQYNDALIPYLVKILSPNYNVILTREPGKNIKLKEITLQKAEESTGHKNEVVKSLLARSELANLKHADVFISLHHDSTSAIHQEFDSKLCHGKGGKTLTRAFKEKYKIGFNIFIDDNKKRKQRDSSLLLAELIGKNMLNMGRIPSNYHVYPIDDCKSCRPINPKLGVWHEDLSVLRNTQMPAVLIEVGNIVDLDDESRISKDDFRMQFSLEIKAALDEFFAKKNV